MSEPNEPSWCWDRVTLSDALGVRAPLLPLVAVADVEIVHEFDAGLPPASDEEIAAIESVFDEWFPTGR